MRLTGITMILGLAACSGDGGATTESGETTGTTGASTSSATATGDAPPTSDTSIGDETTSTSTSTSTTSPTDSGPSTDSEPATGSEGDTSTGAVESGGDSGTSLGDSGTGLDDSSTSLGEGTAETSAGSSTGVDGECADGEQEACYTGPQDTLGVGPCKAGQRTCEDGVWGGCVGDVLPAVESCNTGVDEACDGDADACGAYQWSRIFSGAGSDNGREVAVDGAGNVVVALTSTGSLDLGGGVLVNAGGVDLFVARYAPDGQHLWSKRFGGPGEQFLTSGDLAVSAAGDIVITGSFEGPIDLGGGPLQPGNFQSSFVARLGSDGSHVWSKGLVNDLGVKANAVRFTPQGDVVLGGSLVGSYDFGGGALQSAGGSDAFIVKYTGAGAHVWSKRFGDAVTQGVTGLDATASGGVCIGGVFLGTIDLGGGPLDSVGDYDGFLGCLSAQGAALWSRRYGTPAGDAFVGVAVGDAGRVHMVGRVLAAVDLGGGPVGGGPLPNSVVAAYDAGGAHLWSRVVGTKDAFADDVAVDGLGAVLVAGGFAVVNDFGVGPVDPTGVSDVFVVKYDHVGAPIWSQVLVGSGDDDAHAVASGATNTVAVTGSFLGMFDPGSGVTVGNQLVDGFLTVFAP